jgi:hypothetical protein
MQPHRLIMLPRHQITPYSLPRQTLPLLPWSRPPLSWQHVPLHPLPRQTRGNTHPHPLPLLRRTSRPRHPR